MNFTLMYLVLLTTLRWERGFYRFLHIWSSTHVVGGGCLYMYNLHHILQSLMHYVGFGCFVRGAGSAKFTTPNIWMSVILNSNFMLIKVAQHYSTSWCCSFGVERFGHFKNLVPFYIGPHLQRNNVHFTRVNRQLGPTSTLFESYINIYLEMWHTLDTRSHQFIQILITHGNIALQKC